MFAAKFLQQDIHNNIDAALTRRSKLFSRRVKMREPRRADVSEPPSISPMTAALVAVAKQRTRCPEVPSVSALNTADVEFGTEAQDMPLPKVKNSGRKRKNEVLDATPRNRSVRKKSGTRNRKTEPSAAIA